MFGDIKEDIYSVENSYAYLSLFSKKLRVGIVGAGRGAYIKAKTFVERGSLVDIIGLEVCEDICRLKEKYNNINIHVGHYSSSFIADKHLIIIAINDINVIQEIIEECNKNYKIYINSSEYINGMGTIPFQRETKSMAFGINSKVGNPKGTIFIGSKVKGVIENYDEFMNYVSEKRNWLKRNRSIDNEENFKKILSFINSDEFYFFYIKGYGDQIIMMFLED